MKVLVLGASGMLGNTMVRVLSEKEDWQVYGTVRLEDSKRFFLADIADRLLSGIDALHDDSLLQAFIRTRPDIVVNCIGLIKRLTDAEDPLQAIPINSLLPHRLARLCKLSGTRMVHISTDCVFAGDKGGYLESDPSDAEDLYGRSKFLGEVTYPHTITLRTSIIGHELNRGHSLVEWFLSQQGKCNGFTRAIFSGLPTVVLAQIIRDIVIPCKELSGLYHVAAEPISKYNLLKIIADVYDKEIDIIPSDQLVIDRSLNADRFQKVTGYVVPSWTEMIELMHAYK